MESFTSPPLLPESRSVSSRLKSVAFDSVNQRFYFDLLVEQISVWIPCLGDYAFAASHDLQSSIRRGDLFSWIYNIKTKELIGTPEPLISCVIQ